MLSLSYPNKGEYLSFRIHRSLVVEGYQLRSGGNPAADQPIKAVAAWEDKVNPGYESSELVGPENFYKLSDKKRLGHAAFIKLVRVISTKSMPSLGTIVKSAVESPSLRATHKDRGISTQSSSLF